MTDKVRISMDVPSDITVRGLAQALADLGASNVDVGSFGANSEKEEANEGRPTVRDVLIRAGVSEQELRKVESKCALSHELAASCTSPTPAEALRVAFPWGVTPQGGFYWAHLCSVLESDGELISADHAEALMTQKLNERKM